MGEQWQDKEGSPLIETVMAVGLGSLGLSSFFDPWPTDPDWRPHRPRREITFIDTPKPLSKRAKRRLRGKHKDPTP